MQMSGHHLLSDGYYPIRKAAADQMLLAVHASEKTPKSEPARESVDLPSGQIDTVSLHKGPGRRALIGPSRRLRLCASPRVRRA